MGKKTANKDPRTAALGMNTVDTALAKADQTEQSTVFKAIEGIKDAGSAIQSGSKAL